jgi:hypothetical protein
MSRLLRSGALLLATLAPAQEAPSFHREVLPLLQRHCVGCHRPGKAKGEVDLNSHAALMRGAGDGSGIVDRDAPGSSLLLEVVAPGADGAGPAMPKDEAPLGADEVELLRRWLVAGAVDDSPAGVGLPQRPTAPPVYRRPPVVAGLAWSPDGHWLAVPGRHEVLLVDMVGDAPPRRLLGRAPRIEALGFAPDGGRLAVVGGAPGRFGEVQVWGVEDGQPLLEQLCGSDSLFGLSWSPDGRLLAFGATDTAVRALDATSGAEVLFQGAHDDWVLDTTFSTDGSHLVTVGRDRSMKLTKVETQQFIDNITSITPGALKGGLMAVARHPQRDELLVGGADGTPALYRMYREKKRVIGDDFNRIRSFAPLAGRVFDVAFAGADGAMVAAVASDARGGEVAAFRCEDGTELFRRRTPAGLYALAAAPDGKRIAVAGFAGEVLVFDLQGGAEPVRLAPFPMLSATTEGLR